MYGYNMLPDDAQFEKRDADHHRDAPWLDERGAVDAENKMPTFSSHSMPTRDRRRVRTRPRRTEQSKLVAVAFSDQLRQ